MKHSIITVEGTKYSVTHNEDATYTVTTDSNRSLTILPKVGAYLTYKWNTIEGTESPLIEKIGFSIESHNFKKIVNISDEPKNSASVLA
jgi:hypothetical protein